MFAENNYLNLLLNYILKLHFFIYHLIQHRDRKLVYRYELPKTITLLSLRIKTKNLKTNDFGCTA